MLPEPVAGLCRCQEEVLPGQGHCGPPRRGEAAGPAQCGTIARLSVRAPSVRSVLTLGPGWMPHAALRASACPRSPDGARWARAGRCSRIRVISEPEAGLEPAACALQVRTTHSTGQYQLESGPSDGINEHSGACLRAQMCAGCVRRYAWSSRTSVVLSRSGTTLAIVRPSAPRSGALRSPFEQHAVSHNSTRRRRGNPAWRARRDIARDHRRP